jgi:hypothetical protein
VVPPSSNKVSRVSLYSGFLPLPSDFTYGAFTLYGRLSQNRSVICPLTYVGPNPRINPGLGSYPFARHYSGNRCFFLFLRVLRCFSSPGSPCITIDCSFHDALTEVCSAGFPHSEICGSMDICSSPQLIAAYHVFLRLLVPRHPPCALTCLTCIQSLLFVCLAWQTVLVCFFELFLVSLQACVSFLKHKELVVCLIRSLRSNKLDVCLTWRFMSYKSLRQSLSM